MSINIGVLIGSLLLFVVGALTLIAIERNDDNDAEVVYVAPFAVGVICLSFWLMYTSLLT